MMDVTVVDITPKVPAAPVNNNKKSILRQDTEYVCQINIEDWDCAELKARR